MDVVRYITASSIVVSMLVVPLAFAHADAPLYCGTTQWQSYIASAATRFDLPERWLHAVVRAESGGCDTINGAPTVSSAGAMGLMQLMPSTWAAYREQLQLGNDPHNPLDNVLAGSAYLRDLYERYGWPGALAAYNAGPTRYDEYLSVGRPLPRATLDYLANVERLTADAAPLASVNRALFVVRPPPSRSSDDGANDTSIDELFVALRHGDRRRKNAEEVSADVQK